MKRSGVNVKNYEANIYHESAKKNMGRKVERAPSSETISLIALLCHTPINSTKFAKI